MAARKRTPQSKSPTINSTRSERTFKSESGVLSGEHKLEKVERGLRAVGKEWRKMVSIFRNEARKAKKNGHPMIAALYDAIADRVDPQMANSENCLQRLEEATMLANWLPKSPQLRSENRKLTNAKLTVAIYEQAWDEKTKQATLALMSEHGRPATARGAAPEAWELRYLKGMSWADVERQLLPGWKYAIPGDTIRREVSFLEDAFGSLGIEVPRVKQI